MISKFPSILLLFASIASACGCIEPSVQVKKDDSEVVFRGIVVELRDSQRPAELSGFGQDTKKIAVFDVRRVWKGKLGRTFEMPALEEVAACIGFWPGYLKVGSDLLIYARRHGTKEYYTSICGFHKLAKNAAFDFVKLGVGEFPLESK